MGGAGNARLEKGGGGWAGITQHINFIDILALRDKERKKGAGGREGLMQRKSNSKVRRNEGFFEGIRSC